MPLFMPFRKADAAEKAVQVVALPLVALGGIFVVIPLLMLLANSFGDVSDWWGGKGYPGSFKRYLKPGGVYARYLQVRYDSWVQGGLYQWYPERFNLGLVSDTVGTVGMPEGNWRKRAADARECMKETMPWTFFQPLHNSFSWGGASWDLALTFSGQLGYAWRGYLKGKYQRIERLNADMGSGFTQFEGVNVPGIPDIGSDSGWSLGSPLTMEFRVFIKGVVDNGLVAVQSGNYSWAYYLRHLQEIGDKLEALNALFGTSYGDWRDIVLPESAPEHPVQRSYWEKFVIGKASPYILRIADPPALSRAWVAHLSKKYGSLEGAARAFQQAIVPDIPPSSAAATEGNEAYFRDWIAFVRSLPAGDVRAWTPEVVWRGFLEGKYGSLEAAASAHGLSVDTGRVADWPQPALDREFFEDHRVRLFLEGLFQNYVRAWYMMAEATPALSNTMKYTLLFTLLVVATSTGIAYCLSRFMFPPLQMFLAYFLAMTAFPIEAMAVPNFLVLRQTGLLNTIWALALPTAVNGYFIYLIKSAFDAIPREYFEEARLIGASEWRVFSRVALPLAWPMVAVVALYSFLAAYSNFLWALIVGQSREMWTLPVLVFNLRWGHAPPSLIAASLVLMVIPPMAVFLFANRTLQRSLQMRRF